jgi:hypothetical protein
MIEYTVYIGCGLLGLVFLVEGLSKWKDPLDQSSINRRLKACFSEKELEERKEFYNK